MFRFSATYKCISTVYIQYHVIFLDTSFTDNVEGKKISETGKMLNTIFEMIYTRSEALKDLQGIFSFCPRNPSKDFVV